MAVEQASIIAGIAERFGRSPARLIDVARAAHAELGYLSEESMGLIAEALGVERVQVRDAVSFYHFFEREPRGRSVVYLCNAVVERMKGADEVVKAFEEATGVSMGETTSDGAISLAHTACIGLSDQAPSALVNGVPLTNLKPSDVPMIVETLRKGEDVSSLPQAKVTMNLLKRGNVVFSDMDPGAALGKALSLTQVELINEMTVSRLRGRGGAGFPTSMKWNFCRTAKGEAHYVVCNADEGEPGTFKDRVILTECPDLVFEGMTVAGYAIGAKKGFLYLRAEYEYMLADLEAVLAKRREAGLLGKHILGKDFEFDIRIQMGAGAYICGEESALIESLEGKRGAPRDRPPFPVQKGYRNQPTSVNNVETLCCAARIVEKGGAWFAAMGHRDSKGTKALSISGDCERPGVYEVDYGITIRELLDMVGAHDVQAVQVGGPSGQCIGPDAFGRRICFDDLATGGSIIIFGADRDLLEYMRQFTEFFTEESCGWCVPCRVGTTLLLKEYEKILEGSGTKSDLEALKKLGTTVKTMSRCGLGQTAANPILTTIQNFPGLYEARIKADEFIPPFDLAKALEEGCAVTGRNPDLEEKDV